MGLIYLRFGYKLKVTSFSQAWPLVESNLKATGQIWKCQCVCGNSMMMSRFKKMKAVQSTRARRPYLFLKRTDF
jgi:hypothetical protein